jgi:hypothetical protein
MSSEKRRSPRYRSLNIVARNGRVYRTLDLSREGMLLEVDERITPGARLAVDAALGESVVELGGEVVRWSLQDNGRPAVGVRFGDLPPSAERVLRDWLGRRREGP